MTSAGLSRRFWLTLTVGLAAATLTSRAAADTPQALAVLHRLEADASLPPATRFASVQSFDRFLGLDLDAEVGQALPDGARKLIAAREQARADRDFAAADRLRDQLAAMGVEVTDTRAGTTWRLRP